MVAVSKGGLTVEDNLITACVLCNLGKSNSNLLAQLEQIESNPNLLSNPQYKRWLKEFTKQQYFRRRAAIVDGMNQCRSSGKALGRPRRVTGDIDTKVKQLRADGCSLRTIAKEMKLSRTTVARICNAV